MFVPPLCKSTSTETCQSATIKEGGKAPAVFVPPFKKQRVIVQDSSSEEKRGKKDEEDERKGVSVTPVKIKSLVTPSEKSPSTNDATDFKSKEYIQSAALADTSRNELDTEQKLLVGCRSEESTGETCKEVIVSK